MDIDKKIFSIWTWKNPLVLHWILNPGLAFNELILGQRVPKVTLIEKGAKKPLAERSFIPCPHCGTLHSSLKWTPQNDTAFCNWFGLYCDNCGKIIPCVRNLTSALLLSATFPLWYYFKDKWKQKWLVIQKEKFSKPLVLAQPDFKWWYIGLRYAAFMFVSMSIFDFLLFQEVFTCKKLFANAVIWTISGLLFGLFMKKYGGNQPTKQSDIKK